MAVYRTVLVTIIALVFCTSFQNTGSISYFQTPTIMAETDTVVPYPSMTDGVRDTLYQVRSAKGLPLAYYKEIYTGVCFNGECRMLDIKLYWNITGRYLGFELPEGEFLSKSDHEPFSQKEYERLHALLADVLSPLGMYAYSELAPKQAAEETEVDGITAATSKDILEYVVEGAAFTTYTLRTIIYGPVQEQVKMLTKELLTEELALKILESPDVGDKLWALGEINGNLSLSPALRDAIFVYINNGNYNLAERAINAISNDALASDTIQMLLLERFFTLDYGIQKLILDKFKEAPHLSTVVRKDLAKNLKEWEGALLSNVLDLYSAQEAFDAETCRLVSDLLQNDNRYISQKAYNFLASSGLNDEEIDQQLARYRASANDSGR